MLKVISLIIFTFYNLGSLQSQESFSYAFIKNQERNKLDVIELKKKKKIKEINVGNKPAGIAIDSINRQVYVSNPESGNVTQINSKNFKTQKLKLLNL